MEPAAVVQRFSCSKIAGEMLAEARAVGPTLPICLAYLLGYELCPSLQQGWSVEDGALRWDARLDGEAQQAQIAEAIAYAETIGRRLAPSALELRDLAALLNAH